MNSRFLNLNWEQTMDQSSHFDAGLSSNTPVAAADSFALHKLLGGLQNSGNCGENNSLQSHYIGASANSPPKLNLSLLGQLHQSHQSPMGEGLQVPFAVLEQFAADAGFSERAARFSSFGGHNFGQLARTPSRETLSPMSGVQMGLLEGKERAFVGGMRAEMPGGESASTREERVMSDPASGSNAKKRKASQKCKGKDISSAVDVSKVEEDVDSNAKRFRRDVEPENDIVEPKMEQNDGDGSTGNGSQKHLKESNSKVSEPPKDYIHVRARRGQATDSHSLAERVRREKISQRMKLLQDLVPGCNKVTGKAVMLDEIINYVQSLQRQVEFLSMKLAAVNPRLDFNNLTNLFQKDVPQACGPVPNSVYPLASSGMASSSYGNQPQPGSSLNCILEGMETQSFLNLLDATFQQNLNGHQSFCDGFGNSSSQLENFWGDDLHNVVQMDIGHSQDSPPSHFPGTFNHPGSPIITTENGRRLSVSNSCAGPLRTAHGKTDL